MLSLYVYAFSSRQNLLQFYFALLNTLSSSVWISAEASYQFLFRTMENYIAAAEAKKIVCVDLHSAR